MGLYEFDPSDARRFARDQNARIKERGNELQFESCPYCHGGKKNDKYTFSINLQTGQCNCKRASCGVTGNMITLSRDFDFDLGTEVDEYYRPKKKFRKLIQFKHKIEPKDSAIKYLESRNIPEEIAKEYEITTQKGHDNILAFPFFDENGEFVFAKYRKMDFDPEKDTSKEWCESDCKPILFGMKQCKDFKQLVITEGQLDSLSVAAVGINNAVSVPMGKSGFTWVSYCWDWVTQFDEIIVFGDFENGSMTLLNDIKQRFPNKIKFVQEKDYCGCKDANELLQKQGKDAVRNAVNNAQIIPVKRVIKLSEVEKVNPYELPKVGTGLNELDSILCGGLPFGSVCVIAGKRGDGKSTLASQILVNAVDQGYPTFAYSGELPNFLFQAWFDYQAAGDAHIVEKKIGDVIESRYITDPDTSLIHSWYDGLIYLYDNRIIENDEKEDLLKTIELTIMQYGVKVVLIDNLMTAMYIDEPHGSDKYDRQGQFVRRLSNIALKYNCVILLVAHRRKNSFSSDVNDEVSGSGDITNLAGVTISYDRDDNLPDPESQRKLVVAKNRIFGKLTGKDGIILDFDDKAKRIYGKNDGLNKKFGWELTQNFVPADDSDIPFD